jgi:hypothetical protein
MYVYTIPGYYYASTTTTTSVGYYWPLTAPPSMLLHFSFQCCYIVYTACALLCNSIQGRADTPTHMATPQSLLHIHILYRPCSIMNSFLFSLNTTLYSPPRFVCRLDARPSPPIFRANVVTLTLNSSSPVPLNAPLFFKSQSIRIDVLTS